MGLLLFQKLFPALGTSADGRGRGRGLLLLGLLDLGVRDQLPEKLHFSGTEKGVFDIIIKF